ncbi:MAG: hypothetical protein AAF638_00280 [Pseudomonadota bacterium]
MNSNPGLFCVLQFMRANREICHLCVKDRAKAEYLQSQYKQNLTDLVRSILVTFLVAVSHMSNLSEYFAAGSKQGVIGCNLLQVDKAVALPTGAVPKGQRGFLTDSTAPAPVNDLH